MQIRWFTFIILSIIFISSCTKEPDNKHPVVTFINPSGDAPLFSSILDTVVFRVSDDKLVHRISINFVNDELISLTAPFIIDVYSKDTVIEHIIKLGPLEVEQGYILIRAEDESLTKLKYQPVVLTDKPLSGEEIVFGNIEGGQTNLAVFEPIAGLVTNEQSFDYEVEKIEGNGQSDFILSLARNKRFVEVRAVKKAETVWRAEAAFPQAEYVDCYLKDDKLLLADRSGNLKLHHFYTGNVQLYAQVESSKLITAVCFDHQYLYAATQDLQTGKYWLLLFFKASGVFYKQFELSANIQEMLPASDSSGVFMLSANDNEITQVYKFDGLYEIIALQATIADFQFIPPATLRKEFIFIRNKTQIKRLSTLNFVGQIVATGAEINGMAISPDKLDWVYYIDQSFIHFSNSGNLNGLNTGNKLDLITLIKE